MSGTYKPPPPPPQSIVYREGETSPGGRVFATFAAAHRAARLARPSRIMVDATLGTPTIPAGAWDFTDIEDLYGRPGSFAQVIVAQGAALTGLSRVTGLSLINNGSTSPLTLTAPLNLTLDVSASLEAAAGKAPFIEVTATGSLVLTLRFFSYLWENGGAALRVLAGSSSLIFGDTGASLFANTVTGAGSILVENLTSGIGAGAANLSETQTGASDISFV